MLKTICKKASSTICIKNLSNIQKFIKKLKGLPIISSMETTSRKEKDKKLAISNTLIEVNSKPHPNIKTYRKKLSNVLNGQIFESNWFLVDQKLITDFASVTGDRQWIHTDVDKSRIESPFASTVAHGYLIVSLLPKLINEILCDYYFIDDARFILNAGFDKVKFLSPVKANSKIRATVSLSSIVFHRKNIHLVNNIALFSDNSDNLVCTLSIKTIMYF